MYKIEPRNTSQDFRDACQAARQHIHDQGQGRVFWINAVLNPLEPDHISFMVGNQLYFVFVEAAEFTLEGDGGRMLRAAEEANAIPCLMPMKEVREGFEPNRDGWGLLHAEGNQTIDPFVLETDELIELSDWDLQDLAVQIVEDSLRKEGKTILSTQSSLHVDPSLWFEDGGNSYWVVVRAVRMPELDADPPANILEINELCSHEAHGGFFASISVANGDDPFDPDAKENGNYLPLFRGQRMLIRFLGLQEVVTDGANRVPEDRPTDNRPRKELVFQLFSGLDGLFLTLPAWKHLNNIHKAIEFSQTWGQFQDGLPPGEWESLGLIVDPDYAFDPEMLPGFSAGDYPDWLGAAAGTGIPQEFIDEFGKKAASMVSGTWVEYPQHLLPEMKASLRDLGFEVVREEEYD